MKLKNIKFLLVAFLIGSVVACGGKAGQSNTDNIQEAPTVKAKPVAKAKTLGQRMFIMCAACHNVKEGEPHKVGPNLHGLFGAKAGQKDGYAYSEAMKTSGIVWDEDHLRNWLKKPTDYIPGTTMAFIGIQDEAQQTALIEYLKEQTK